MKSSQIKIAIETIPFAESREPFQYEDIRAETIKRLVTELRKYSEEDVRDGLMVNTLFAFGQEQELELSFVDVKLCSGNVDRLIRVEKLSYQNALIQATSGYVRRAGDNAVMSVFAANAEEDLCVG